MNARELYSKLKVSTISIYGTGYIANKFFQYLQRESLHNHVEEFIVTQRKDNYEHHGIPVKEINKIENSNNKIICVAVHESILKEIVAELKKWAIDNYIWIYPYLTELIMGKALSVNRSKDVDELVLNNLGDYRIAIRYAAIEHYYHKNINGAQIYKKAMALHCAGRTAEERLERFQHLIEGWEKEGYNNSSILITEKNHIIDGHHRIVLAKYFKQKDILCDIYPEKVDVDMYHGNSAVLAKNKLVEAEFTLEEIKQLDEINQRLGKKDGE